MSGENRGRKREEVGVQPLRGLADRAPEQDPLGRLLQAPEHDSIYE